MNRRPSWQASRGRNAWGTAKHPYCRGFTPEEFQSIDFSKVDLTEYYGTVLKDIDEKDTGSSRKCF